MKLHTMKKKIRLLLTRISVVTITLALLVAVVPLGATAAEYDFPGYGEAVSYGRGVWTAVTQGSAVCYNSDGDAILCYGVQGGVFCAIDLKTGEVIKEEALYGASQLRSMVTASDGCVYFNAYSQDYLSKYDPKTNKVSEVVNSGFSRNGHTIRSCFADTEGKVYFGTYHSDDGVIYIYDTVTNTTEVTEAVKEGAGYVQGICADENYIYAGTGVSPNAAIVRIDKKTGEKTEFATNEMSIFNELKIVGNKLVAKVNSGIYVYDLTTLKRVSNQATETVSAESPLKENTIYYISPYSGSIYEYDVNTHKSTKVLNTPISISEWEMVGLTGLKWAQVDGEWVLEYHSTYMEYVGYFNPVTGENVLNKTSKISDTGPQIQSLEISPDNVIYMGGYNNGMSAYNIDRGQFDYKEQLWGQNEGVGFLNGKVYFGVYTDARIWRYDPEKEWNYSLYNGDGKYQGADANPAMVYDIDDGQDRPFVVKGYNDKLYVGTMSGYGKLGGALTIYEEDEEGNPSAETYRNVIPDQSITGIAVKDNLVYLSGTIRGGLDSDPTESQAKIAVFDTDKNEVVVEAFAPNLPVVGTTSTTIGEISFGPDGLLWGVSNKSGLVFAMEPETFEVVKYVAVSPGDDRGTLARPLYIRWGEDGLLYTTAAWGIYAINTETMEYKRLVPNCSLMTLDADGNIWFAKGGGFNCIKVNQYARFENIAESIEALDEYEYSYEEYNELMTEYENLKNLISENSQTNEIIEAVNKLEKLKENLVSITGYIDDIDLSIDYAKQQLNLEGKLMKGSSIAIKIVDPDGNTVLFDQLAKNQDNSFSGGYRIDTIKEGEYFVYLQSEKMRESYKIAINSVLPENTLAAESFLSNISGVHAETEVSNYFGEKKEIRLYVAFYEIVNDKKRLYDLKLLDKEINPGGHVYLSDLTDSQDGKEIVVLVWEKGNLKPLIPIKSIVDDSSLN